MFRSTTLLLLGAFAFSYASAQTQSPFSQQISFEENRGQVQPSVRYIFRGQRSAVSLSASQVAVSYRDAQTGAIDSLQMHFDGANPAAPVTAEDLLPGKINYLIGNDPVKWKTNLPTYGRVRYRDIYPGVDAVFYGKEGSLEYDLVLAPGAALGSVRLRFDHIQSVRVTQNGELVVRTSSRELRQQPPAVYQLVNGRRQAVRASFKLESHNTVSFSVPQYDRGRELVIDPTLVYSTLIGTTYINAVKGVAVDGSGAAYATGYTYYQFPTKNPAQGNQPSEDAFVTKFSSNGGGLVYSTYLGGSGVLEQGTAIGVDRYGSAYIVGLTDSSDFPVSTGAIQPANHGGRADAFATKLSPSGSSFVYSTYLGGSDDDGARGLAIDSQHRLYVTGYTCSSNFPVANAYQPTSGTGLCSKPSPGPNAFVTRINADGSSLDYSTYLGGSSGDGAWGIAVDSSYSAYVAGSANSPDFPTTSGAFQRTLPGSGAAFVTKFTPDGRSLVFSTFIGGSGTDGAYAIALDSFNRPYITGVANSTNFPVTRGAFQTTARGMTNAFVTKLWKTGGGLIYSTYLGGSQTDIGYSIAVDANGYAYVAGTTNSPDFPVKNALQASFGGGSGDAFITRLSTNGASLVYSTYFGGSNNEGANSIRLDGAGNAYVGGITTSTNFRTTAGAYQETLKGSSNGFVIKIKP